ncbi:MAG: acyltransferase [Sphingobacteriales bacterium]|nr:acyltransferase [Sphingobacteriales bacterium]
MGLHYLKMIKKIILIFTIFKALKKCFKRVKKSILDSRYFFDVTFKNPSNIKISNSSNIERGSLFLVNDPISNEEKNIIVGDNCWIGKDVEVQTHYSTKVIVSDYASVQSGCKLLGSVSIGKYSILAPDIFISSGNHYYNSNPFLTIREQDAIESSTSEGFLNNNKPVVIEEDCWIGKNVFIKRGTYIGRGAIIGTNCIVTKDIEPYTINVGSPIGKIKDRIDFNPPQNISAFELHHLPYFYRGFEHYSPNKKIADLVTQNHGIASEESSLVVLKQLEGKDVFIRGFAATSGQLNIYINGTLCVKKQLVRASDFEFNIKSDDFGDSTILKDYNLLPLFIKKYHCVQFEFICEDENKKYNSSISEVAMS